VEGWVATRHPAALAPEHSAQQRMRAVSRCQPTYEAEHWPVSIVLLTEVVAQCVGRRQIHLTDRTRELLQWNNTHTHSADTQIDRDTTHREIHASRTAYPCSRMLTVIFKQKSHSFLEFSNKPVGAQLACPYAGMYVHTHRRMDRLKLLKLQPKALYKCDYYYTRLTALCPGLPKWAGTRKVKQIWTLLKQESGSGISWTICKFAPRSRPTTTPAPTTQFFTGQMPFLPPNQQCQSTEGNKCDYCHYYYYKT